MGGQTTLATSSIIQLSFSPVALLLPAAAVGGEPPFDAPSMGTGDVCALSTMVAALERTSSGDSGGSDEVEVTSKIRLLPEVLGEDIT